MKIIRTETIEPSTESCHAGAVAFIGDEPVYAWFGGPAEGHPETSIWIKWKDSHRRLNPLLEGPRRTTPAWNPVFVALDDRLFLFFKMGEFCDRWQTFVSEVSLKGGNLAIGEAKPLPAGVNGPVKTPPVTQGRVAYCGSSVETFHTWTAYVETLWLNGGDEWRCERSLPLIPRGYKGRGLIQPALWRDEHGQLRSLMRSCHGSKFLWHSRMSPGGRWSPPAPTGIPNPNSGVAVIANPLGRAWLVYNPSSTRRTPLTMATLKCEDDDWTAPEVGKILTLDRAGFFEKGTPEVSYPYAVWTPEGNVRVIHTRRRRSLRVTDIEVDR